MISKIKFAALAVVGSLAASVVVVGTSSAHGDYVDYVNSLDNYDSRHCVVRISLDRGGVSGLENPQFDWGTGINTETDYWRQGGVMLSDGVGQYMVKVKVRNEGVGDFVHVILKAPDGRHIWKVSREDCSVLGPEMSDAFAQV